MAVLTLLLLGTASYVLYPALLWLATRFVRRPWLRQEAQPTVTILVSAFNEEAVIEAKVRNALALDYPAALREIIVCSDGSTDRTNEIVARFDDPAVVLDAGADRVGKTASLNRAVLRAKGTILLFTDANAMFPSSLLRTLTRNFASPEIGLVTGWTCYRNPAGELWSIGLYTAVERRTREWESAIGSCIGADGAVFAMRAQLFTPLAQADINDFVLPLQVVRQGYRAVMDPEAYCIEEHGEDPPREFRRQIRITTQTLRALGRHSDLLNVGSTGAFALFLWSHKVLRFLSPFFLTGALLVNLLLVTASPFYAALLAVQALGIAAGISGILSRSSGGIARLAGFVLLTLGAQAVAWIRAVRGAEDTVWTPRQ